MNKSSKFILERKKVSESDKWIPVDLTSFYVEGIDFFGLNETSIGQYKSIIFTFNGSIEYNGAYTCVYVQGREHKRSNITSVSITGMWLQINIL